MKKHCKESTSPIPSREERKRTLCEGRGKPQMRMGGGWGCSRKRRILGGRGPGGGERGADRLRTEKPSGKKEYPIDLATTLPVKKRIASAFE